MSTETVSVKYVGPCAEVITRRGITFTQGEAKDLPREYAEKLSGDYEIDGVPISDVEKPAAKVSGPARKLAEDNDIDLATVQGTGTNESVTKGDVQKAVEAKELATAAEEAEG